MFAMDLIHARHPSVIARCFSDVPVTFIRQQAAMLMSDGASSQAEGGGIAEADDQDEQQHKGKQRKHHHHKKQHPPPPTKGSINPFSMESPSFYGQIDERLVGSFRTSLSVLSSHLFLSHLVSLLVVARLQTPPFSDFSDLHSFSRFFFCLVVCLIVLCAL